MTTEQMEHHKKTMHKAVEYVKRHKNDFMKTYKAQQVSLEFTRYMFDEYKKKVLMEQALDYVSK